MMTLLAFCASIVMADTPATTHAQSDSELVQSTNAFLQGSLLTQPEVIAALEDVQANGSVDSDRILNAGYDRPLGVDLLAAAPYGAGIELTYNFKRMFTVGADVSTLLVANSVGALARIQILPILNQDNTWSPSVGISFHHVWTTPYLNEQLSKHEKELGLDAVDYDFSGISANFINPAVGIEHASPKSGIHFSLMLGRAFQVGTLSDIPLTVQDYDIVIHNQTSPLQAYTVSIAAGYRFGAKKKGKKK